MEIKYADPAALVPYENNTKQHPPEQVDRIAESIRRFGWWQPIVIDRENVVIVGHGRLAAAKQLMLDRVPVVYADTLTPEQVQAYRLADNRTNESPWDMGKLEEELAALNLAGVDMAAFGFDDMAELAKEAPDIVEDEAPEPPEEPQAKRGQIWRLGEHRLMCGDSTSAEDLAALTDGSEIRLLLTDPPYNVSLGSNKKPFTDHNQSILNDSMEEADFTGFLRQAFRNADAVMMPGCAFYIFYAGLNHTAFDLAIRDVKGWKVSEQLVWIKSNHALSRSADYQWKHEPCLYGWKTGAEHYFTDSRAETTVIEDTKTKLVSLKKSELIKLCERLLGENASTTALFAEKSNTAEIHPSVKPQGLIAPLLLNSSRGGWNVLDPFGGSGSTMIACEQTGRKCFMMELDPHYADVIIKRWEDFTGNKAELIRG